MEERSIDTMTREEALKTLGFELKHIGVNCESEEAAIQTADAFGGIFGLETKFGNSSVFSGTVLEAIKKPYLGANGHIAMGTTDVEAAVKYLESQDVLFDMSTAKYKDDKMIAVYLTGEFGGFAVHLVKK